MQIVEIPGATLENLPVWRLTSEPVVSIGVETGDAPYLFEAIFRNGIAPLGDGSIAIVDGLGFRGSYEIRVFDGRGLFLRKYGGKGEGPGEFASAPEIRANGEGGIVAMDGYRITVFDLEGRVTDDWPVSKTGCPDLCTVRGVLGNGNLSVYSAPRTPRTAELSVGQTVEEDGFYGIATRDSARLPVKLPLPTRYVYKRPPMTARGGAIAQTGTALGRAILSPSPESRIISGQKHFAVNLHDPIEFRIFDFDGSPVRVIRIIRPHVPLTDAEKNQLQGGPGSDDYQEGRAVMDYWPEYDYVRFGENDDLWIPDFARTLDEAAPRYQWITIISVEGVPLARLEVPPNPIWRDQMRSATYEAPSSRDFFRIITQDSLGVPRLLIFGIEKDSTAM